MANSRIVRNRFRLQLLLHAIPNGIPNIKPITCPIYEIVLCTP